MAFSPTYFLLFVLVFSFSSFPFFSSPFLLLPPILFFRPPRVPPRICVLTISPCSRYKNIDPKMIELIMNQVMDTGAPVSWDDIAGLEFQKSMVKEIVVLPMLRPDIFTGLRCPGGGFGRG